MEHGVPPPLVIFTDELGIYIRKFRAFVNVNVPFSMQRSALAGVTGRALAHTWACFVRNDAIYTSNTTEEGCLEGDVRSFTFFHGRGMELFAGTHNTRNSQQTPIPWC